MVEAVVPMHIVPHIYYESRGVFLAVAAIATSMIVNALMTGLIVFRIFKVFREIKAAANFGCHWREHNSAYHVHIN